MGLRILILIFLKRRLVSNEALHFHELIHVVQWQSLAPNAAVPIGAHPIGDARLRHLRKDLAVRHFAIVVIHVEHADV